MVNEMFIVDENYFKDCLTEDLGSPWQDATSEFLFENTEQPGHALINSKEHHPFVLSGVEVVKRLFCCLDAHASFEKFHEDKTLILPGQPILGIRAKALALHQGERTALNFLRHLSGIATFTHAFVEAVKHTHMQILDTRKTTPLLRTLEKYAVRCGGGVNHRMGLYDAIMIKDTHVDMLGGMPAVLERFKQHPTTPKISIFIEVREPSELQLILTQSPTLVSRVLLDNMSLEKMRECVQLNAGVIPLEATGNLNLNNIVAVAETGVDYASIGAITHSARQVDISMKSIR